MSLSHPTLGLTTERISKLDQEVNAIYQLDSEVSLLKHYEHLRASNVGSLQFLISLAHGNVLNTKAIRYLYVNSVRPAGPAGKRVAPDHVIRVWGGVYSSSGIALDGTAINCRILEGSLQTGFVPDFSSQRGGGMS